MKFDRLLSIVLLLQHRDLVPARELAERLEVSQRTIHRDVEALSAAGVPVYATRGKDGGIGLLAGFRTDVTGLTTDEARALFVLASQSAHSALGLDHALGSALRKVMAALPAPHRPAAELTSRRILVEPDRWHAPPRPETNLEDLYAAVLSDRRLRVRYRHGGRTELRTYTVDPYGLVAKAGIWYLVADHKRTPRLLRTDRLSQVGVLEAEARRRPGIELAQVWHHLRREVEDRSTGVRVTVRVRRERLDMVTRIAGGYFTAPPVPEASSDELSRVELVYPVLEAVRHLMQFGTDVRIVGPPEARAETARAITELAAVYGTA
ncbi:helix-turn-helix transcriptional regulator [Streptomyces genisteinicus]|uniref:WYL domain-containing protein n=1 Tax=Streptomyces genisteinicus TaxID=2768068 RepID=A0A7H0I4S0_9ACTN|nr:WYL domain-containing protein [Streptomyces genisteinicus]QNP67786.1 WYL domain-containing protein [Streptomyces genisteinicus]